MHRNRLWTAAVALVAMSTLVAACGDDDDDSADSATTGATTAVAETTTGGDATTTSGGDAATSTSGAGATSTTAGSSLVAGCENGLTDPSDLDPDRPIARCEKGAPAAVPLAQREKVRISSSTRLEFMSPILLAQSYGEFEKENLEVEVVTLTFADAAPQLAQGSLDAAVGGLEIALFNAGNQGLPIKAALGNYFPPHAGDRTTPQTGLWCRRDAFTTPDDPADKELEAMTWGSAVGKGSASVYASANEIGKRTPDFDITKADIQRLPSADIVTALQNGALDCGILLDPTWLQIADDPGYVLMATNPPGEPLGMLAYGKTLLQDKPEVGVAVARAIIRTINTYYNGDYHADPTVLAEISKVTNQPLESLTQTPSLVMDWEFREGTTTRIQELFIKLGVITEFTTPVPEETVVDRSFYERAVGAA